MKMASEPYRTALLITMSISYRRYFSTAMAIATHRHKNARLGSTFATTEFARLDVRSVATTSTAAAANHFSCSRSSPADQTNLTTTAATLTTSATDGRMSNGASSGFPAWLYGSDQRRVAFTSRSTAMSANTPPTNHAAGRHRGERSCPVGKSRNTKASMAGGITQIQLDTQAGARAAGKDPGAAIRACSPYCSEKLCSASARPATRNSQPIRFAGRLDARTKPTTGTARFSTSPKTSENSQRVRPAGARCRFTYTRTSPPAISATEPAAIQPATHRAVKTLIRFSQRRSCSRTPRYGGPAQRPGAATGRFLASSAPLTPSGPIAATPRRQVQCCPASSGGQGGHPVRASSCQHPGATMSTLWAAREAAQATAITSIRHGLTQRRRAPHATRELCPAYALNRLYADPSVRREAARLASPHSVGTWGCLGPGAATTRTHPRHKGQLDDSRPRSPCRHGCGRPGRCCPRAACPPARRG